jgi:hypothetical protein
VKKNPGRRAIATACAGHYMPSARTPAKREEINAFFNAKREGRLVMRPKSYR